MALCVTLVLLRNKLIIFVSLDACYLSLKYQTQTYSTDLNP
jgi:hypothetical protein